jgi:rod shape-determining protein MreD
MSLTLAAVGAVVAALVELTVVPYLGIGGAEPYLVLVCAVVWTVVAGIEGGLIWAFIGGLMIDLLAPRPLGSTAFTLLICVGVAAVLGRALNRVRYLAPVIAVFVCATAYSLLFLVVYGALRGPIPVADPIREVLPNVIYTTVVGAIIGPLAVLVASRRRREADRIEW